MEKATEKEKIEELRGIFENNEGFRAFFLYLANRKEGTLRKRSVKAFCDRFAKLGIQMGRQELIKLLKRLDALGYGKYVVGRHNKQTRFVWSADSVSVGMVAAKKSDKIEWLADQLNEESEKTDESELLVHSFRLRRDLTLAFSLPADLSQAEAQRLAGFITTLPFGED